MTRPPVPASVPEGLGVPPEAELMLLASAGALGRDRFQELARTPLDWDRVSTLAMWSHATSALWHQLKETPELPQGPHTARLQSLGVITEFRLHHVAKLLEELVGLLAQHDVHVILLKGAALLCGATSRRIDRSMSDLDLVVIDGSAEEAWRVCREAGWSLLYEEASHQYEEHHHLPPLRDPDGIGLGLELHRSLFQQGSTLGIDEAAMVRRARFVPVGAATARIPTLEDMLLYACIHFGWGHSFESHAWSSFHDAHAIVSDPAFSWERFLALVRETRVGSCCYWTLRLARSGARLPVPEEVLDALPGPSLRLVGAALERHFFAQLYDPATATTPVRLRQVLWQVAIRPSRSGLGKARPWLRRAPNVRPVTEAQRDKAGGGWARSIATLRYLWGLFATPKKPHPLSH